MQLLDFSSDNLEIDNKEYWKELMNDNNEYNDYIFDDDSNVNKISDTDTQSDNEDVESFSPDLREWALCNNISHKAISELLHLLLKYIPNCFLPKDARTLLHTPRTTNCVNIAGGEYLHFGLLNVLNLLMEKYIDAKLAVDSITLSMNVDGLPISRSSSYCLWLILISDEIFKSVHMIGAYYGSGKPTSANDFLEQFIYELKILIKDGFMYSTRRISVTLSTIICDTPAKSFVLYTKSHTGFSSCSKCTIIEKSINNTTCFPYTNKTYLRTDEDFLQQTDEKYHQGKTLLLQIPNIGLVSAVALDYMHLVCLGVTKKLLLLWMKGPLTVRIGNTNTNLISQRLIALKNSIPKEISRKPRSLSEIKYWKATEFRQFLLYTGPIVLKSILKQEIYEHFLTLHVAISILISPTLITNNENIKYAEELLVNFVKGFQVLYSKQFVSHNVHNLIHLSNEVRRNGILDNFSAFPFENFLGSLKKLIRKPEKPLQQLARRYDEQQSVMFQEQLLVPTYQVKHEHHYGPLVPEFPQKIGENLTLSVAYMKSHVPQPYYRYL
ncbi:uncharacterized protein LOC115243742 [Formica exsecta]|uniref:uncharacterized protein LOC115243742 n=2 Tax=Formica exsecta TaxID=72781 RepID=UPI0011432832|nr:uncharacterized protein LOC115243742 [Formica exsecta]